MAETFDLILKGATVVNQDGESVRDLGINAGKIVAIGQASGAAAETIDCRCLHILRAGPARVFGIAAKGRIAAGYDADLTVVDLRRRQTITDAWIASRPGWTPYNNVSVMGWPVGTFVRGRKVMWEGDLTGPSQGEAIAFHETIGALAH
jgi:dihydroorotase-like cyclic amidohydrolase